MRLEFINHPDQGNIYNCVTIVLHLGAFITMSESAEAIVSGLTQLKMLLGEIAFAGKLSDL